MGTCLVLLNNHFVMDVCLVNWRNFSRNDLESCPRIPRNRHFDQPSFHCFEKCCAIRSRLQFSSWRESCLATVRVNKRTSTWAHTQLASSRLVRSLYLKKGLDPKFALCTFLWQHVQIWSLHATYICQIADKQGPAKVDVQQKPQCFICVIEGGWF